MIRSILIILWIAAYLLILFPVFLFELVLHFINREASQRQCQYLIQFMMKVASRLAGIRLTVRGRENIPEEGGVLFVPNHRSYFDFVTTVSVICPLYNIGKKELAYPPIVGWWIWLMGTLFLDRSSPKAGLQVIREATELVKQGKRVLIYPEGTRNKGTMEELLPFHEGSLKISAWSGCKVVPVALLNTRDIYEAHRPFVRSTEVTMVFGTPIDPASLAPEDRKHLGAYVRKVITEMILEEEGRKNG